MIPFGATRKREKLTLSNRLRLYSSEIAALPFSTPSHQQDEDADDTGSVDAPIGSLSPSLEVPGQHYGYVLMETINPTGGDQPIRS
jgi:hypothetical protein